MNEVLHDFAIIVNGLFFPSNTVSNWSLLLDKEAIDFVYCSYIRLPLEGTACIHTKECKLFFH